MSRNQIDLDLIALTDRNGAKYYACFPDLPLTVRLDEIAFFIFTTEDGNESLVVRKRERKENLKNDRERPEFRDPRVETR